MKTALEYGEQIVQLRDKVREERAKLDEIRKRYKARIESLEERIDNLCDLQLGRTGAQEEIPGAAAAGALVAAREVDRG